MRGVPTFLLVAAESGSEDGSSTGEVECRGRDVPLPMGVTGGVKAESAGGECGGLRFACAVFTDRRMGDAQEAIVRTIYPSQRISKAQVSP